MVAWVTATVEAYLWHSFVQYDRAAYASVSCVVTVDSHYTGLGYTGLHIFRSLYRRTQQNSTGIICMGARTIIPDISLYRISFDLAHINLLCPV